MVYAIFGHAPLVARLIQAVIVGVAMPWLTWRICRRLFGPRPALIAAAISAVYLYFITYAAALVVLLLCLPFVVRNYRLFGVVGMPNTNVGINFFWANHPVFGTQFEAMLSPEHGVSYHDLIPPELRGLNDALRIRARTLRLPSGQVYGGLLAELAGM